MTKQIATVAFHGTPLTVITHDSQQLVAMKPIVEAIGLQWEAQYKRIQRHPVLKPAMSIMDIPSAGGNQRTACLPIDYLNGWLFGVDVNRVREEIRDTLIQYQRECYQVLSNYWQKGEAKPQRKTHPKALPNGLTIDQQDAIKAMVKARVEALPQNKRAKGAITCWSALKSKFGCTYKEIPTEHFTDAASLVARVPLEGEWLGKEDIGTDKVIWSASRWLEESMPDVRERMTQFQGGGNIMITPDMLCGPAEFISPTLEAISELESLGHNLEACRLEVLAMKHHLEGAQHLFEGVRLWAERTHRRGIRFKIAEDRTGLLK